MRYKMTLSYDGSSFCGWQIQPREPSVQESLEKALSVLFSEKISVTGAGRTDALVNAFGYVAHFDAAASDDCSRLLYKLNAILPDGIAVESLEVADDGFHARFDATRREYTYFLHRRKDPFVSGYSYLYTYPSLDFEVMNKAAAQLLGRHDFGCFEKSGSDTRSSVCSVFEAFWEPYVPTLQAVSGRGEDVGDCYWYFRISADRFLRNMVRAVVGTLLEIGRGKRDAGSISELVGPPLEEGVTPPKTGTRRSLSGESVPGHALFLSSVKYD